MFLHHLELANIDIGFITDAWINNTTDVDSVISQAKNLGTLLSHTNVQIKEGTYVHSEIRIKGENFSSQRNHLMD